MLPKPCVRYSKPYPALHAAHILSLRLGQVLGKSWLVEERPPFAAPNLGTERANSTSSPKNPYPFWHAADQLVLEKNPD